jgi:hypothetical protein
MVAAAAFLLTGGQTPNTETDIFEFMEFSVSSLVDSNPNDSIFEINTGSGEGTGPAGADIIFVFCNREQDICNPVGQPAKF